MDDLLFPDGLESLPADTVIVLLLENLLLVAHLQGYDLFVSLVEVGITLTIALVLVTWRWSQKHALAILGLLRNLTTKFILLSQLQGLDLVHGRDLVFILARDDKRLASLI